MRPLAFRQLLRAALCSAAVAAALAANSASAGTLLYANDFEAPTGFVDTTTRDVSQQNVNSLYGQPGFQFQQLFTVETLEINGGTAFGTGYSDPQSTGGNYALGMLSSVQDDRASLTFDVGSFSFLNVAMDISAIDLDGVGGPFGVAQPIFRISLYDSPGGAFNISSPGTLLAQVDLAGSGTASASVFSWTSVVAALDASASQDGNVSIVFDLIQSGYASFDNLRVVASDTPGDVPEPALTALLGVGLVALGATRRRRTKP